VELRTLSDCEHYLDGFVNRERMATFDYERLGLGRIRALLDAIGRPERGLPCVHVTGSNGKGTVVLATEVLLRAAGLRVGTYTSPHLESWRERFRIDGRPIDDAALLAALRELQPAADKQAADPELRPSFFDVTTALALLAFRRARVDAAVVEVGIGGRLDSTNVVEPRASVITTVQLEHTDKLGTTLEAIAREKAGIIKPGVPVVHGQLHAEAAGPVLARAVAEDAPIEEVAVRDVQLDEAGLRFALSDGRALASPVLGLRQARNLALAVRASEHFLARPLRSEELGALGALVLPARIERLRTAQGDVVLDSAHSPDAARALRETLAHLWPDSPWVLVGSISRDKDAAGIFEAWGAACRAAVLTSAEPSRSTPPEQLEPLAWASGIQQIEVVPEPLAALERAQALRRPGERVVVAGSIFLAGAVRGALLAAQSAVTRAPVR
jgi:dihydrofolate synthase / folylpolyglutamate synthase